MENGKLNIQERSLQFSVEVINFVNLLPKNSAGIVIGKQLIRCGTSVGSNIEEAQDASSKKDFIQKLSISLREAKETRYWLNVIIRAKLVVKDACKQILQEINEIIAILITIVRNTKSGINKSK